MDEGSTTATNTSSSSVEMSKRNTTVQKKIHQHQHQHHVHHYDDNGNNDDEEENSLESQRLIDPSHRQGYHVVSTSSSSSRFGKRRVVGGGGEKENNGNSSNQGTAGKVKKQRNDDGDDNDDGLSHDEGISDWEAGVSLAKAIMGAGSFALPWAFSNMGYIAGPIFMILLLILSVYSLRLLVQCSRMSDTIAMTTTTTKTKTTKSYVQVAKAAFGMTGARLAYFASISASIGVCGSYLVFIAANVHSLLFDDGDEDNVNAANDAVTSTTSTTTSSAPFYLTQNQLIFIIVPFAITLSAIKNMKLFAFASLLGDVSVILGMVVVLVYGYLYHHHNVDQETNENTDRHNSNNNDCVAFGSIETMPLAFGAIGYLFLVHFLVLPIESSMKSSSSSSSSTLKDENTAKAGNNFILVAQITFTLCALMSGIFGICGYFLFGSSTKQIVLLNVTQGSFFVSAVKILLCIDLLLTYPVVMRPSIIIIEQSIGSKLSYFLTTTKTTLTTTSSMPTGVSFSDPTTAAGATVATTTSTIPTNRTMTTSSSNNDNNIPHWIACIGLGMVASTCSIIVPAFGLLSGLVGGVSQTFLAFCLPPLMLISLKHKITTTKKQEEAVAVVAIKTRRQEQQQQQQGIAEQQKEEEEDDASFVSTILCQLKWIEFIPVMFGAILIIWTLISTWKEL